MATVIVIVLTKVRPKRRHDDSMIFSCSGINSDSMICCITAYDAANIKNLEPGQTVIVRGCWVFNRDEIVYLQIDSTMKVRYIFY